MGRQKEDSIMAGVKNTFDDLSNHLFEQLERLNDADDGSTLEAFIEEKGLARK